MLARRALENSYQFMPLLRTDRTYVVNDKCTGGVSSEGYSDTFPAMRTVLPLLDYV